MRASVNIDLLSLLRAVERELEFPALAERE